MTSLLSTPSELEIAQVLLSFQPPSQISAIQDPLQALAEEEFERQLIGLGQLDAQDSACRQLAEGGFFLEVGDVCTAHLRYVSGSGTYLWPVKLQSVRQTVASVMCFGSNQRLEVPLACLQPYESAHFVGAPKSCEGYSLPLALERANEALDFQCQIDLTVCPVCGSGHSTDKDPFLVCDESEALIHGVHVNCLGLKEAPEGEWMCPTHA